MVAKAKEEVGRRLSYKFRLYPTESQERFFSMNFGCARYVFNYFLRARIDAYEATRETIKRPKIVEGTEDEWVRDEKGNVVYEEFPNPTFDPAAKPMSFFDTSKALTQLKKDTLDENGHAWLKDADSTALIYSLRNLDAAYQNFFRRVKKGENPGFPKFKSKSGSQSFKTASCTVTDGAVVLPKIGRVKAKIHREVEGKIVSATISKTTSGKYFVAVNVKEAPLPETPAPASNAVGLTYGVSHWAVTSDGIVHDLPHKIESLQKKLAREQRRLSRKVGARKGENASANYQKQKLKVARVEEQIANIRANATHELTRSIVNEYEIIASRDMQTKQLVGSEDGAVAPLSRAAKRRLNRKIVSGNFAEVNRQLAYKSEWAGRTFVEVPNDVATAQICSSCGHIEKSVGSHMKEEWECSACGTIHNRKYNGAKNVLQAGLAIMKDEQQPQ